MRLNKRGQFIPITAMVMFTTVVFLVAVVNIYKVTRAKLKVQNLADAVALNIASQMASSMNKVADLNEWMNHFVDLGPNGQPSKPGEVPNCIGIDPDLPPLSCAENALKTTGLNMFSSLKNAQAYATLVKRINQAQHLFATTYNNFIGAGQSSGGSSMSNSSLHSILLSDIPELSNPGTHVVVWNSLDGSQAQASNAGGGGLDTSGMKELRFKTHDVLIGYWKKPKLIGKGKVDPQFRTLGDVLVGEEKKQTAISENDKVGWKVLDTGPMAPVIAVGGSQGKVRSGAGAMVSRQVQVPLIGSVTVVGRAQAYVVEGSGMMGADRKKDMMGVDRPVFKPTYWVKLAGVQ